MPDLFELLSRWWKQVLGTVIIATVISGIIIFLKPQQYRSVSTAVPASTFANDRSRIFGEHIEALYAALGTPDDLDLILGTAQLDTAYRAVVLDLQLKDHYKVNEKDEAALIKATGILKQNTSVRKSGYGELKVIVWDKDPVMAAKLSNGIMHYLQLIHQDIRSAGNEVTLKGLRTGHEKLRKAPDSAGTSTANRIMQYDELIGQYQLLVDTKPPVLVIVEKAKPASYPDKPKRLQVILGTLIISFFFALLAVLALERRKSKPV